MISLLLAYLFIVKILLGNIAVALYSDDGQTKKLIWKSDLKKMRRTEKIFLIKMKKPNLKKLLDEKITEIKKDAALWVASFY